MRQGTRSGPRVACPTCGLRIPLDTIVADGHRRMLVCTRCHGTNTWNIVVPRAPAS